MEYSRYLGDGVTATYDNIEDNSAITRCGVGHPKGNTFITSDGRILSRYGISTCDGLCICAYITGLRIYAAVQRGGNTELVCIDRINGTTRIMSTIEYRVMIINIFLDKENNIVFATDSGVFKSLSTSGDEVTPTIPCDVVGISNRSMVKYNGVSYLHENELLKREVVDGYNEKCEWSNTRVYTRGGQFNVGRTVDEAFVDYHEFNLILIVLSNKKLYVTVCERDSKYEESLPGEWLRAPMNVGELLYCVRYDGVLIDLRTVWDKCHLYYKDRGFCKMIHNVKVM